MKKFDRQRAAKMVVKRYRHQQKRGQEGFGFVALKDGHFERMVKAETDNAIIAQMLGKREDEIMFHHRRPTSTPNYSMTAHPMHVSHPSLKHDYYIIHNGVVHDTEKIKEAHEKAGFTYSTLLKQFWLSTDKVAHRAGEKWNDSETFAIELAKDLDANKEGLGELSGTIAFIALQIDKKTKAAIALYWGRNHSSPLLFTKNNDYMQLVSEGTGEEVKPHTLHCYDYETGSVSTLEDYKVGLTSYGAIPTYKGGTYHKGSYSESGHYYDRHSQDRDDIDDVVDKINFDGVRDSVTQLAKDKIVGFTRPEIAAPKNSAAHIFAGVATTTEDERKRNTTRTVDQAMSELDDWADMGDELLKLQLTIKDIEDSEIPDTEALEYLYDRKETLEDEIKKLESVKVNVQ